MPRRRRTARQELRSFVLQAIVALVLLVLMLNVVLPWAGQYLSETYRQQILSPSPNATPAPAVRRVG